MICDEQCIDLMCILFVRRNRVLPHRELRDPAFFPVSSEARSQTPSLEDCAADAPDMANAVVIPDEGAGALRSRCQAASRPEAGMTNPWSLSQLPRPDDGQIDCSATITACARMGDRLPVSWGRICLVYLP
jgi:hypothetical protein